MFKYPINKQMKNTFSKGFTLVELLIVITILAALAAAVVAVINPMELLAQGRDAQRMSDLDTVQDALLILLAQGLVPSPDLCVGAITFGATTVDGCHPGGICMVNPGDGNGPFATQTCAIHAIRAVNGAGWVDVDLTDVRVGGSLITMLPVDPINNAQFFYAYRATPAGTFKLAGRLESARYRTMMIDDGGIRNECTTHTASSCFYEIGSNLTL